MSFYIYAIHNIFNNKIYIGKTTNPQKRWGKHLKIATSSREKEKFYIHRAIAKYGSDSFVFSIVQKLNTRQEYDAAEKYWIKYFQSNKPGYGYNLTEGGEGVSGRIVSEITRQKLREKAIGRKHTEETIISMSGDNNHRSKLTSNQINEIRNKFNNLNYNLVILSKEYDVSSRTIARAIYNKYWYDPNYIAPVPNKINHNGKPKLNLDKANQIRKMYQEGISKLDLSKLFGVTKENISAIINDKIWRNK